MRLALIGILLVVPLAVKAADLNAPATNQPTVGSEIARGAAAAFNCVIDNYASALRAGQCITELDSQNRQRTTTYEPFNLGLNFRGWVLADAHAFPEKPRDSDIGRTVANDWRRAAAPLFVVFRDYQKRLGVTDDQLITAGGNIRV